MGRKRINKIEKEENRATAELMQKVIGDRTYKEAAEDAGVDPSTLSYICRGKVKPTPEIITEIMKPNSKPQGGITLDEFMVVAQYQKNTDDRLKRLFSYYNELKNLTGQNNKDITENDISKMEHNFIQVEERCCRIMLQSFMENKIGVLEQNRDWCNENSQYRADVVYKILKDGTNITEWLFEFKINNNKESNHFHGFNPMDVFAQIMRFGLIKPTMKVSIVVNDKVEFERFSRWKDKLPFRGELSVILIDYDNEKVLDEVYLANYELDNKSNEFYIA